MIVALLVLTAVLLSIIAIIVSFFPHRRLSTFDESNVDTAAQLEAAMAMQWSKRISELQQRMTDRNYWPYALLGLALLMQTAAVVVDHLAHPSIAVVGVLPAFCVVLVIRASRRRYAQRQLDSYVRRDSSSRTA
jgi:hypothetical protein